MSTVLGLRRFTLTSQHVKLLRQSNVRYSGNCEWGYVGLDCKRPFGNGDLVGDMARIIGIESVQTDDGEEHWPPGTRDKMVRMFKDELPIALSVVLAAGTFEPGEYECGQYADSWRPVAATAVAEKATAATPSQV